MDRFEAMRTLVAAIDRGSLSAASRFLNIPLPTVSRRVSDLEALLGAQLVIRTSRKLVLTETGFAYVTSARRVLEALAEAERAASGEYQAPRGELLVTAPVLFGTRYVAPIIHEFLGAYPEVTIRLILSDTIVDLVDNHIDVAVRIGHLPDSALVARHAGAIRWVVCASPDYLNRRAAPVVPDELCNHDCIAFEGLRRQRTWPFVDAKGGRQTITIQPSFSANTSEAIIDGAIAGLGIARVLSYQAARSVEGGTLIPILSDFAPPPMPVQLVYAAHHQKTLKLSAFLDFVAPRVQQQLYAISDIFGAIERPAETP